MRGGSFERRPTRSEVRAAATCGIPVSSKSRLIGGGGVFATMLVMGCQRTAPQYEAIDLTGVQFGRALSLPDSCDRTRTLEDFKGRYVLLFFGFTQCPDVYRPRWRGRYGCAS